MTVVSSEELRKAADIIQEFSGDEFTYYCASDLRSDAETLEESEREEARVAELAQEIIEDRYGSRSSIWDLYAEEWRRTARELIKRYPALLERKGS